MCSTITRNPGVGRTSHHYVRTRTMDRQSGHLLGLSGRATTSWIMTHHDHDQIICRISKVGRSAVDVERHGHLHLPRYRFEPDIAADTPTTWGCLCLWYLLYIVVVAASSMSYISNSQLSANYDEGQKCMLWVEWRVAAGWGIAMTSVSLV